MLFFYTDIYSQYFRKDLIYCPKQTPIKIICMVFLFKLTLSKVFCITLYKYIDASL